MSRRLTDLESILPESIWIEITDKNRDILLCNVYRPPHLANEFWERLNICIERASEVSKHIILVGDINEDQLSTTSNKFKHVTMINNMTNVIKEPTRVTEHAQTLINPIVVTTEISVYDSGILKTPQEISDHYGTYVYISSNMPSAAPFKRKVRNYNRGDYILLIFLIQTTDWSFINTGNLNTACDTFHNKLIEIINVRIPSSLVTIRPNHKPWYNSVIRKTSRQRDRQKTIALRTKTVNDWSVYKEIRNKVNNMKKYAKQIFFDNLEFTMQDLNTTDPRQYWKLVKMLVKENSNSCDNPTTTQNRQHLYIY